MEEILLSYGLPGVIILVLAAVVAKLYADNKNLYIKIDSIQEVRLQDARETRDKLADQMDILNKTIGLIYEKLRDSKRES